MALKEEFHLVLDAKAELGEGPVWDSSRNLLWFVDIKKQHLWRFDPASGEGHYFEAPQEIGWALPTDKATLMCGLKDGLYLFDPATERFAKYADVPGEAESNRLNDACTDKWGRIWFGSMDNAEQNPSGRFYVFDRGKITASGPDNIVITNGPAVNADNSSIYFTDTLAQKIYHAPLARGNIGPIRPFADILSDFPHAYPDGPFTDSQGNVLTGLFNGGKIVSYSPSGKLDKTYDVPAQNVTKACFGGPDLRILYATTARKGLSEEALIAVPESGGVFARAMDRAGNANIPVAL